VTSRANAVQLLAAEHWVGEVRHHIPDDALAVRAQFHLIYDGLLSGAAARTAVHPHIAVIVLRREG
jgi:hypothetical protein